MTDLKQSRAVLQDTLVVASGDGCEKQVSISPSSSSAALDSSFSDTSDSHEPLLRPGSRDGDESQIANIAYLPATSPLAKRHVFIWALVFVLLTTFGSTLVAMRSDAVLSKLASLQSWHGLGFGTSLLRTPQREWDYYAQPGVLQVNLSSTSGSLARFLQYRDLESLLLEGKSGLEDDVRMGEGADALRSYLRKGSYRTKGRSCLCGNGRKIELTRAFSHRHARRVHAEQDDRPHRGQYRSLRTPIHLRSLGGSRTWHRLHKGEQDLTTIMDVKSDDDWAEPHRCFIRWDDGAYTEIWTLMLYGVTGTEDDWKHKEMALTPRRADRKVQIFGEALAKLGIVPQLVIMHSM